MRAKSRRDKTHGVNVPSASICADKHVILSFVESCRFVCVACVRACVHSRCAKISRSHGNMTESVESGERGARTTLRLFFYFSFFSFPPSRNARVHGGERRLSSFLLRRRFHSSPRSRSIGRRFARFVLEKPRRSGDGGVQISRHNNNTMRHDDKHAILERVLVRSMAFSRGNRGNAIANPNRHFHRSERLIG